MFEVALGLMQVAGFLASTYFIFAWLPASWRARKKGLIDMTGLAYVDFIGFPIAAFVVYSLTMLNLYMVGIRGSSNAVEWAMRFGVWGMLGTIVTIRAIHWTREWMATPRTPTLADDPTNKE